MPVVTVFVVVIRDAETCEFVTAYVIERVFEEDRVGEREEAAESEFEVVVGVGLLGVDAPRVVQQLDIVQVHAHQLQRVFLPLNISQRLATVYLELRNQRPVQRLLKQRVSHFPVHAPTLQKDLFHVQIVVVCINLRISPFLS